jgi:hypothetical protein
MTDKQLQDFVADTRSKSRITFGDVRRLQRDYLPAGLSSEQDALALIDLDAAIERADKAWADWLVAAIVNFVATTEASESGLVERIRALLELHEASSESSRKIARRIRREIRTSHPLPDAEPNDAAPEIELSEIPIVTNGGAEPLQLAA